MSETWQLRVFDTPQRCDFCGRSVSSMRHFSTIKVRNTTEYKSFFMCGLCLHFRYIPTTETEPSYGGE